MPGFDGTGPLGNGPVGRGMGSCGGGQTGLGRGRGFRYGNGRDRVMLSSTLTPDDQFKLLEQQKSWLETQLAIITQRLQVLGKNRE